MARKARERPLVEMHGRQYGRWTVKEFSHWQSPPSGKRRDYWKCCCSCGTERPVKGISLRNGDTLSCGCIAAEKTRERQLRPEGEAMLTHLLAQYRMGARRRNIQFDLSMEHFRELIVQDCRYCGSAPVLREVSSLNGGFVGNGIDRIDNEAGYTHDNCVPCCKTCNIGKGAMSHADWISYLNRLVAFRTRREDASACM